MRDRGPRASVLLVPAELAAILRTPVVVLIIALMASPLTAAVFLLLMTVPAALSLWPARSLAAARVPAWVPALIEASVAAGIPATIPTTASTPTGHSRAPLSYL